MTQDLIKRQVAKLFWLLVFWCPLMVRADEGATVRVLSYNIHHAEGMDGRLDLERIANVIQESKPDIVALQEVDRNTERTGNLDQAAQIAERTNMNFAFGANIELQGGQYGNAVLSRWPIVKHENRSLPRMNHGEQRGAIDALIESPHGMIRILATHLDHRTDPSERMESIKQIDFVMFRPADAWQTVETKVLDESIASDHRPILSVLKLVQAAGQ